MGREKKRKKRKEREKREKGGSHFPGSFSSLWEKMRGRKVE